MKILDLFSGIGGFSLGLERAGPFRTVAFCEREPFCQEVLKKHWPKVPIYDDVKTIPTNRLGRIDLICGGFPCQPWSTAGQRRGAEDDRDLWPVMASLIKKLQPEWVIGENVRGFVNEPLGLRRSLSDLESLGYQAIPFIIPACAVDAKHRRDRVWIIAHTNSNSEPNGSLNGYKGSRKLGTANNVANSRRKLRQAGAEVTKNVRGEFEDRGSCHNDQRSGEDVADTNSNRRKGKWSKRNDAEPFRLCGGETQREKNFWLTEPDVGRVAHGVPRRVDRLKALGNAVVPQVVEQIGRAIIKSYEVKH